MEAGKKKTESEVKVKIIAESVKAQRDKIMTAEKRISFLTEQVEKMRNRVKALEEHLRSLDHGNEQGNDVRDGGWFD